MPYSCVAQASSDAELELKGSKSTLTGSAIWLWWKQCHEPSSSHQFYRCYGYHSQMGGCFRCWKNHSQLGGFHDCFNHKKSPVYAVGFAARIGWIRLAEMTLGLSSVPSASVCDFVAVWHVFGEFWGTVGTKHNGTSEKWNMGSFSLSMCVWTTLSCRSHLLLSSATFPCFNCSRTFARRGNVLDSSQFD